MPPEPCGSATSTRTPPRPPQSPVTAGDGSSASVSATARAAWSVATPAPAQALDRPTRRRRPFPPVRCRSSTSSSSRRPGTSCRTEPPPPSPRASRRPHGISTPATRSRSTPRSPPPASRCSSSTTSTAASRYGRRTRRRGSPRRRVPSRARISFSRTRSWSTERRNRHGHQCCLDRIPRRNDVEHPRLPFRLVRLLNTGSHDAAGAEGLLPCAPPAFGPHPRARRLRSGHGGRDAPPDHPQREGCHGRDHHARGDQSAAPR